MNFNEFKLNTLGINMDEFGKIFGFVDFGNVNHWFDKDRYDIAGRLMNENEFLIVDIEKMGSFLNLFCEKKLFYYGFDSAHKQSWHIHKKAKNCGFVKVSKPLQIIKHYLDNNELNEKILKRLENDGGGYFVKIPKGNFDVEISIDSIRLMDHYNTFCIFSGDSDFAYLAKFLKQKGKKIMVIASGNVFHTLKEQSDLYINAQQIKGEITCLKRKTPLV
jgi:uncharacterized LabA/DUF88 family protein